MNDMTPVRVRESPGSRHAATGALLCSAITSLAIRDWVECNAASVISATVRNQHSATVTFLQAGCSLRADARGRVPAQASIPLLEALPERPARQQATNEATATAAIANR